MVDLVQLAETLDQLTESQLQRLFRMTEFETLVKINAVSGRSVQSQLSENEDGGKGYFPIRTNKDANSN